MLHSSTARATVHAGPVATKLLHALREVGLDPKRSRLRLMLRQFGPSGPVADGIFSDGDGARGYFLYAPRNLSSPEIEALLFHSIDLVPFFQTHTDGTEERLFQADSLPNFPELPPAIITQWTARDGASDILSRGVSHPRYDS